ncbi:MAG: hypothetical protein HFE84_09740 [Lachnospiraceae bacterium]|nr:hypothetical protein [Lachnospiraceae bacterium]
MKKNVHYGAFSSPTSFADGAAALFAAASFVFQGCDSESVTKEVITTDINKRTLFRFLIFNKEIPYNEHITLYPIKMEHILDFQQCQEALTLRKDSIFHEKQILKMEYLDFIKFAFRNRTLAANYSLPLLPFYYDFLIAILKLACGNDAKVEYDASTLAISVNGFKITNSVFEDLRNIILIQNDVDFDVDEFINIDTVKALEKAQEFESKKNHEKADIEDYIDSLAVRMNVTEDSISQLTIRKFWRYIKRINKHDEYQACRSGQMSGMVTFKEPLRHWMTSMEVRDPYEKLKANEDELRSKIG